MRKALLVIPLLIGVASSGFFSDLLKGIFDSDKGKDDPEDPFTKFIAAIPSNLLNQLETDEEEAGQFVCAIRNGDIPEALRDLGTDIWDRIEDGFDEVASFIKSIPSIPIEIFENIIEDGEDVVSVVGELFTDPGGVVTLVENDVKTIVSDIESAAESLWHGFTCLFKHCTTPDPAAMLSSSCGQIMAAAATTSSLATSSSTYVPAQPTSTPSPTVARQTSTTTSREAAQTSTKTVSQATQSLTKEAESSAAVSSATAQGTSGSGNIQTSPSGSGSGSTIVQLDGIQVFFLQTWLAVVIYLLV